MSKTVELLKTLVGFNTTSSLPNRDCIDFIAGYLRNIGITSTIIPYADGTKASLFANIGPKGPRGIVLAGHTDVVPVEGQKWSSDPFTLTERDGKFYGRGSCDMKAFIACILAVLPEFVGKELKQPIQLAFTHDEETDMSGAERLTQHMRQHNMTPDWVWIGEPTSLHLIDAHKGVAYFTTHITGIPGHSGQPDKGLNAIAMASSFLDILLTVAETKKTQAFNPSRFDPPYTTLNLGLIKGGTAENIIAEHCEVGWQTRVHPGDDHDAMLKVIDDQARHALQPRFAAFAPHAGIKTCTCFNIPPLSPTPNNPGQKILSKLTGHSQTEAVSFGTEAGFYQQLGTHVIVCGPGSIDQAHKADEFVEKSQLDAGTKLLREVLNGLVS